MQVTTKRNQRVGAAVLRAWRRAARLQQQVRTMRQAVAQRYNGYLYRDALAAWQRFTHQQRAIKAQCLAIFSAFELRRQRLAVWQWRQAALEARAAGHLRVATEAKAFRLWVQGIGIAQRRRAATQHCRIQRFSHGMRHLKAAMFQRRQRRRWLRRVFCDWRRAAATRRRCRRSVDRGMQHWALRCGRQRLHIWRQQAVVGHRLAVHRRQTLKNMLLRHFSAWQAMATKRAQGRMTATLVRSAVAQRTLQGLWVHWHRHFVAVRHHRLRLLWQYWRSWAMRMAAQKAKRQRLCLAQQALRERKLQRNLAAWSEYVRLVVAHRQHQALMGKRSHALAHLLQRRYKQLAVRAWSRWRAVNDQWTAVQRMAAAAIEFGTIPRVFAGWKAHTQRMRAWEAVGSRLRTAFTLQRLRECWSHLVVYAERKAQQRRSIAVAEGFATKRLQGIGWRRLRNFAALQRRWNRFYSGRNAAAQLHGLSAWRDFVRRRKRCSEQRTKARRFHADSLQRRVLFNLQAATSSRRSCRRRGEALEHRRWERQCRGVLMTWRMRYRRRKLGRAMQRCSIAAALHGVFHHWRQLSLLHRAEAWRSSRLRARTSRVLQQWRAWSHKAAALRVAAAAVTAMGRRCQSRNALQRWHQAAVAAAFHRHWRRSTLFFAWKSYTAAAAAAREAGAARLSSLAQHRAMTLAWQALRGNVALQRQRRQGIVAICSKQMLRVAFTLFQQHSQEMKQWKAAAVWRQSCQVQRGLLHWRRFTQRCAMERQHWEMAVRHHRATLLRKCFDAFPRDFIDPELLKSSVLLRCSGVNTAASMHSAFPALSSANPSFSAALTTPRKPASSSSAPSWSLPSSAPRSTQPPLTAYDLQGN